MENPQFQLESAKLPELQNAATNLIAQEAAAVITTAADNDKAADLAKLLRQYLKKIEDDRKSITDPLNGVIKTINAKYKPMTEELNASIDSLKGKMTNYARLEAERLRREQEERRRAEEEAALAAAADMAPEDAEKTLNEAAEKGSAIGNQAVSIRGNGLSVGGSSHTASKLTVGITDADAVPVEFKSVDMAKVNAFIDVEKAKYRAEGVAANLSGPALTAYVNGKIADNVKIPGIVIQNDLQVVVR